MTEFRRRRRARHPDEKPGQPSKLGEVVSSYLKQAGFRSRMSQADVVSRWRELVGRQIADVTQPEYVTKDGVLFVCVRTSAWMNELSFMEPDILRSVNAAGADPPIAKIRFRLKR